MTLALATALPVSLPHRMTRARNGVPVVETCAPSEEAPEALSLKPGDRVGEYVVQGTLADGGMSTVYSALHPLIGKRAAVKVIAPSLSRDAQAVKRFLLEARAVNQIRHPNIVDVFACGRLVDGRSYLVMEWLDGETLGQRLWDQRLTLDDACDILLQVCDALDAAHDEKIVHLDLKPENVFLVPVRGGRTLVKLLDFGIAKLINDQTDKNETAPAFAGTPEYASPEQAQGFMALDGKSDAYSLGVMAYEIFGGRLPFSAPSIPELLLCHVKKAPPPMDLSWAGSPAGLERLILDLLAKDPDARPSMSEIRQRLTVIREIAMRVPTLPVIPSVRPRPSFLTSAAVAGVCIALSLGGWTRFRSKANAAAPSHPAGAHAALEQRAPVVVPMPIAPAIVTTEAALAPSPMKPKRMHRRRVAAAPAAMAAPLSAMDDDYLLDLSGRRR